MLWSLNVQKKSILNPLLQILRERKGIVVQGQLSPCRCLYVTLTFAFAALCQKFSFPSYQVPSSHFNSPPLLFSMATSGKIILSCIPWVLHVYFYSCTRHIVLYLFAYLPVFFPR